VQGAGAISASLALKLAQTPSDRRPPGSSGGKLQFRTTPLSISLCFVMLPFTGREKGNPILDRTNAVIENMTLSPRPREQVPDSASCVTSRLCGLGAGEGWSGCIQRFPNDDGAISQAAFQIQCWLLNEAVAQKSKAEGEAERDRPRGYES